jgi:uncharacterized protein (TIGR02302 family)
MGLHLLHTMNNTLKRVSAWCALWLEQLTQAFWPFFSFVAIMLSLWLLNLHGVLPKPGAKLLLGLAFLGAGYLAYYGVRHLKPPAIDSVDRRLEQEAGLAHRPFDGLNDRQASRGSARTHALWLENRKRLQSTLRNLRFVLPKPQIAIYDPRALRIASLLLLFIAAVIAGPQWQQRLTSALLPFQWQHQMTAPDNIIIWLKPPDYTGLEQQVINGRPADEKRLSIPAGSDLKIRLKGGLGTPYLDTGAATQSLAFDQQGGGNYAIETQIPRDAQKTEQLKSKKHRELSVTQLFFSRARIPYTLIPDQPPEIRFDKGDDVLKNARLRFHLQLRDDYGLSKLAINVSAVSSLDGSSALPDIGSAVNRTRILNIGGSQNYQAIHPVFDLSAHPWAGHHVKIRFTVYDAAGQTAKTKPVRVKLPMRNFTHPVAQRLIEHRRKLIRGVDKDLRSDIRRDLYELARRPESYQGDITSFLAMRSAAARLNYSPGMETRRALIDLLWATALRIEDGDYPFAERNLRQAGRELEKTLNSSEASDEDIARALKRYQQALGQYMKALKKKMQKQITSGEMQVVPSKMLKNAMQPGNMQSMLEKMRAQALSGDREQARRQLAEMQRMLNRMNSAMQQKIPEDVQKTAQGMKNLQSLINKQKKLHERTRQADKTKSNTDKEQQAQQEMARQQAGLEKKLESIMDKLPDMAGKARETLQKARKEMENASQSLQNGKNPEAASHQARALKYMRQSGQKMTQALRERLSNMTGIALGRRGGRDPLGRAYNQGDNPGKGGDIKIPIKGEQRPIHQLIELLRQRAGELERPREERNYYRRLLEQWQ